MGLPPVEIINENSVSSNKPVAYVLDDDKQIGTLVQRMLSSLGYIALAYGDAALCIQEIKVAKGYSKPSLILLDLSLGKSDALDVVDRLKAIGYKGKVMLISGSDESMLEEIRKMAMLRGMAMLPSLKKPFRLDALKECLEAEPEVVAAAAPAEVTRASVEWGVANGMLELRYQLKFNLKTASPCGADALYYARHPAEGIVPLSNALPPPSSGLFAPLARFVLRQVAADWTYHFSASKTPFKCSVKFPLAFVSTPGFISLMRDAMPNVYQFPGLVIEAIDSKQFSDEKLLREVATQLKLYRFELSVDDVGALYASIAKAERMPFGELRLPRGIFSNCSRDAAQKDMCAEIVRLAHNVGATVCASGVSTRDEVAVLTEIGCDTAVGKVFGPPQLVDAISTMLRGPSAEPPPVASVNDDAYVWPVSQAMA